MNLLIVDDNPQTRQQLESMLKKEGYHVKTARHGKEALTLLQDEHVDGIISEIVMPVMDGFQLCRTVKLDDTLKEVPFIFLTDTVLDEDDEPFAVDLGADLFLRTAEPGKVLPEIHKALQYPKKPKKVLEEKDYLHEYSQRLKKKLDNILRMHVRDDSGSIIYEGNEPSTERKKAEDQLESEEKYRNIVELAPDGIVTVDLKGAITSCNTATLKLTGYSEDEVIGRHFSKLGFLRARDLPKYIEIFSSIIKGKIPEPVEVAWNHKDGTAHLGEVHVSLMKKEGKTTGIQVITRDITERKRAEEELRESEEKYRNMVELAPDGIATVNLKGVITSCNTAFSHLTGFSKDELVGKHFTKLPTLRVKDLPVYVKLFSSIIRGKISGPVEFTWRHKDGSLRLGEAHLSLMKKRGNIVGVQGIARDITERKKAEEMLRLSEEKYRTLIENLNVGVYRAAPGKEGRFIDVNHAFAEMLGYEDKEEVVKLKVSDIYMNPKDRKKFSEKISLQGFVKNEELHVKRKDGIPIIISDTATPVYDTDGTLLYFDGISEDITERKKMEEALKESEEKYRNLVETSKDSIVIIDVKGNVLFANKATEELTGYPMEEGLHMNVRQITPLRYWPKSLAMLKKAITGEPVPYFESVIRRKDGTLVPVESGGQAIFRDGKIAGVQVITRDITERKRAEEQMKASLKEKEVLLQEIHHRVKNNMQIIHSLLNLQSRHIEDQKLREVFKDSQNRIKSMALVHEKLYQSEDLARIDFKEYITSLVNSLFRSCRTDIRRITLTIEVEDVALGSDHAVPCGLIINELVSNCVKHAFPGTRRGKITIKLRQRNENEIELLVSDNGVGIPDSIDVTHTESLGLRLVTILAEDQLKGKIRVDRTRGTEVSIIFKAT